jgi:glutamate carboxypeptidase
MSAAVATTREPLHAAITFEPGYPPLEPAEGNLALLSRYDATSRDLGLGTVSAVSPDKAGAADVAFISTIVPSVIDAAGLKGHDDHSPSETADLRTLPVQTKRAALLLARLARTRVSISQSTSNASSASMRAR